jgi:PAS domain S-box-containing protein
VGPPREELEPASTEPWSPGLDLDHAERLWRRDLSTGALWGTAAVGAILVALFFPRLLAAGSYGTLVVALGGLGLHVTLAWRTDLGPSLRGAWLAALFTLAGTPGFLTDGDRGIATAQYLLAVAIAATIAGWRAGLAIALLQTTLLGAFAVGFAVGALPIAEVLTPNWTTPAGWLALWMTAAQTALFSVASTTYGLRLVRRVLRERNAEAARRERALQDLVREREERSRLTDQLADTLAAVSAGLWEHDPARGEVTWSDGLCTLLGLPPGSPAGMDAWLARVHPDDRERIGRTPTTEHSRLDFRVVTPDGRERWLRALRHATFAADGSLSRVRSLVTDIDAEREVAQQLARLAEVANRTMHPVVVTDLQGDIEWVNGAFTELTGWRLEEVRGRRPGAFLQTEHTDPATKADMARAIAAREPFQVEVLNVDRAGRQYWLQVDCRVARDADGEPIGFVAIEVDVTERRVTAQRDALARRVASLLLGSDSVAEAARLLVQELVRELDIRVAQLWVVEPGHPHLRYVDGEAAASAGAAGEAFVAISRSLPFAAGDDLAPGVGLPGAAWGTGRTAATPYLDAVSRRRPSAEAAGLQTFCAVPVRGPSGVLAVIEVGGTRLYPGHELIPTILERIAEQVAAFLLHDASRRAFRSVFERSPDALLLVDEDGRVRDANARAVEWFGAARGRPIDDLIDEGAAWVREAAASDGRAAAPVGATLRQGRARGPRGDFSAEVSAAVAPLPAARTVVLSVRDLTERHRMEAALTASLHEKEMLLREVHHRVKNNLQIVSSLISMQADAIAPSPARDSLTDMIHRVRSMSYVHQQLYGSHSLDRVDLGEYARTLARALVGSLDPSASLTLHVEPVEVTVEQAIPCGLVINELVTNALKSGRDAEGRCTLHLGVRRDGEHVVIEVRDRGPGFPEGPARAGSLGMTLIRTLARQLRAELGLHTDGGAVATLRFTVASPRSDV